MVIIVGKYLDKINYTLCLATFGGARQRGFRGEKIRFFDEKSNFLTPKQPPLRGSEAAEHYYKINMSTYLIGFG